jgi:biotin transport system substrate-specific component
VAVLPQGFLQLLGLSGGYLLSYPFAAFVAGWLAERRFDRRYLGSVAAMAAGLAVIFVGGVLWLAWLAQPVAVGLDAALRTGLYPFLPGDLFKILIGATVLPVVWKFIGTERE